MRYTNGNYEAFARSRKPKDVEKKQAYIVGGGLAGLAAAVFLISLDSIFGGGRCFGAR